MISRHVPCPFCRSVEPHETVDCEFRDATTRMKAKGFVHCWPYEKTLIKAGVPVEKAPVMVRAGLDRTAPELVLGCWAPAWAYEACVLLARSGERSPKDVAILLANGQDDPQLQAELAAEALRPPP